MWAENPVLTIGVVADTHVPDRAVRLNHGLLPALRGHKVDHILHAGDICRPDVLEELGEVAPVTAVRGNRDWAFSGSLPWARTVELAGVSIGLVHGHGSLTDYLWDKIQYLVEGYRLERYLQVIRKRAPQAQVIVFGHTHRPANVVVDGVLYFNPGSANFSPPERHGSPGFGILRIYSQQRVLGQLYRLG